MVNEIAQKKTHVLDPIDRTSEIIFGILMATTFTGSLSVATTGSQEIRTMMFAALACNIAWGITDAVMYLIGIMTERQRKITLLKQLESIEDPHAGQRLIANALPEQIAAGANPFVLEAMRKQLLTIKAPPSVLGKQEYAGALGVLVLVVFSTFPVVIPFLFFTDPLIALRVSNLLAIIGIFACGVVLGRYAGATPWHYGLAMTSICVALIVIIIALGG